MEKVKMYDQRFGGHRITKSIEFEPPLRTRKPQEFFLTYFNEGTGKERTERMVRALKIDMNLEHYVVLFFKHSKTRLFFSVDAKHLIE